MFIVSSDAFMLPPPLTVTTFLQLQDSNGVRSDGPSAPVSVLLAALGGVPVFLQALQALVQPLDAQRHILAGDAHGRGGVEVRTRVRLRVRHEAAERVSVYGLLLAQRHHPGNRRGKGA